MKITPIPAFKDNYLWLLVEGDHAYVVDPGDADPVEARLAAEGLTLAGILCTHHHRDHTGGIAALVDHWNCPVWGPAYETIPHMTHPLREGDMVEVFGRVFRVLEVPGHTVGHIAYHSDGILLVGDTLFAGGCGRLFEGTPEQMQHSLAKIAALPPATQVYCAHEYTLANLAFARAVEPGNSVLAARASACHALRERGEPTVPSRLAEELATNPFLRWDVAEVRAAASAWAGRELATPVDVFATVRRWKDEF